MNVDKTPLRDAEGDGEPLDWKSWDDLNICGAWLAVTSFLAEWAVSPILSWTGLDRLGQAEEHRLAIERPAVP